jgi:PAS domain S-box-containing protein
MQRQKDTDREGARSVWPAHTDQLAVRQLAAIVESSDDAIISKDSQGRITSWNAGAQRLYGYESDEVLGKPVKLLVPEWLRNEETQILAKILAGKRTDRYDTQRVRKDKTVVDVSLTVSPLRDEAGAVVGASVIARDITAERKAVRQKEFLAKASALLDTSLDPVKTLQGIADLAVPAVCELCVVDLLNSEGEIRGAAVAASDPEVAKASEGLRKRHPIDPRSSHPVARVARTTKPELIEYFTDSLLGQIAQSNEHLALMKELNYQSALVAPMVARGRTVGVLSLLHLDAGRRYEAADLVLAEDLARRAATALDNAQLHWRVAQAEQNARFLAESSQVLASSLDYETTLQTVARLAVAQIADWCAVDVLEADGSLKHVALAHQDPRKVSLAQTMRRRYPEQSDLVSHDVIDNGGSRMFRQITQAQLEAAAETQEHLNWLRELDTRSVMVVPMAARGRRFGVITFATAGAPRYFDDPDLALAEELARSAAVAVENARLYSQRSHIAKALEASLLPHTLPKIAGLDLAARYRSGGEGCEVGGDFYDVFPNEDSSWSVVMGDVCGKGPEAAALTAMARYTVRATAASKQSPTEVLETLNSVLLGHAVDEHFCTMVYASLRPGSSAVSIELAVAGHPLPLLVRSHTASELGNPGTLLGVYPNPVLTASRTELKRGDTLVLYTDGLTEAKVGKGRFGNDRLEGLAKSYSDLDARALAKQLETAVPDAGNELRDDVAVLVVKVG